MKKGFIKKTSSASKILLSSIIFATTGFIGVSLASVSSPIYSPGETLSPTCSPGEANCGVSMNLDSLTNVKAITEQNNDLLFYDTDGWNRLGHGEDGQVLKYTTGNGIEWVDNNTNSESPVRDGTGLASLAATGIKGPGKITLTNGGSTVVGIGTEFLDETETGFYYNYYNSLRTLVIDSLGNKYYISFKNITSNTTASISSVYLYLKIH